jgi:uncharacterized membrane protein YjfL (UPF0719 family)
MGDSTVYVSVFGATTILALLLVHRLLHRFVLQRRSLKEDLLGKNRAYALREVGNVLAVFIVGAAVVKSALRGEDWRHDALWCAAYAGLGLVLLELTAHVGLRMLLRRRLSAALERGNEAAGLAAAAHYVAMGILTSRAVAGNDLTGLGLSAAFFALGVVTHQSVLALFRALTTYDDAEQIDGENIAAALSYAGVSLAVALVIARALEGDFPGWPAALRGFGSLVACTAALYPLRQLLVQGLVLGARPALRGGELDVAVGRDRNVSVAALETACYLGGALAVVALA